MSQPVYAYLRVSGMSQKDGDGFTRQRAAIAEFCERNGLTLAGEFTDTHTGTEENRPGLAAMMVSLEQNGHDIRTVVIERMDRLARDLMVQEAIVADFQTKRFALLSATPGEEDLLNDDPTRELVRHFMGAVAQYDKRMLVAKLRAAKDRLRAEGYKVEGRNGYRDTAEGRTTLRTIHALRRTPRTGRRRTYQQVATELNRRGVPTLSGQPWTGHRVYQTAHAKQNQQTQRP